MTTATLTKRDARKVLAVVDAGLVSGLGKPIPGQTCVEAAIALALGYEFNDQPVCVARFIRQYKIRINDAKWSSNAARTAGMRRAAIAQLGSNFLDRPENRQIRKECVIFIAEQVIRRILPLPLRAVAAKHKDKVHAARLIESALRCENEGTREAALDARDISRAAAADAAADAAAAAAYAAAAYAAAAADADADAADADAAYAAAAAAAADADADADAADAKAKARDEILSIAAEICVDACVKFKTPGSKWLDITE